MDISKLKESIEIFTSDLNEKLLGISAVLNKAIQDYKDAYPIYVKAVENAREHGWSVPAMWQISFISYESVAYMNEDQITDYYVTEFEKDNYALVYSELGSLRELVPNGYSEEIDKIIDILKSDFEKYTLMIPVLFSFLDMLCVILIEGNLETKEYMKKSILEKYQEENPWTGNKDTKAFTSIVHENLVLLLREQIKYRRFDEKPIFNRNFVLHGRFNPIKYEKKMFYQLVLLCSTTAIFIHDLEEKEIYLKKTNQV